MHSHSMNVAPTLRCATSVARTDGFSQRGRATIFRGGHMLIAWRHLGPGAIHTRCNAHLQRFRGHATYSGQVVHPTPATPGAAPPVLQRPRTRCTSGGTTRTSRQAASCAHALAQTHKNRFPSLGAEATTASVVAAIATQRRRRGGRRGEGNSSTNAAAKGAWRACARWCAQSGCKYMYQAAGGSCDVRVSCNAGSRSCCRSGTR